MMSLVDIPSVRCVSTKRPSRLRCAYTSPDELCPDASPYGRASWQTKSICDPTPRPTPRRKKNEKMKEKRSKNESESNRSGHRGATKYVRRQIKCQAVSPYACQDVSVCCLDRCLHPRRTKSRIICVETLICLAIFGGTTAKRRNRQERLQ